MARKKFTTQRTIADMEPIPFRGGCNTYLPAITLPSGKFSMIQNMRATHPGFKARTGMLKLHSTAHTATKVLSAFHFSKGKRSEKHFLAQFSDGDLYEATTQPPGVTAGAFGTLKYSGDSSAIPAAYSVMDDSLLYSDGVDQHQLFPGDANPVTSFHVYSSAVALPLIPALGNDYTMEVLDTATSTYAVISALGTNAADTILICCPTVPSKLNIVMSTSVNAVVSALTIKYMKSGSPDAFTTVGASLSDGTATGGATFAKSGTISWDALTDMVPSFMFGISGFWLALTVSVALSATVRINQVTYGGAFQPLQNVWDGDSIPALEARFYIHASVAYFTYYGASIDVSSMVATNDAIYFNTIDNIRAIYIDATSTPSTTASVTPHLYYWNGSVFTTEVSNLVDNTVGMTKPGWMTFDKVSAEKTMFQTSYYSYWWKLTITGGNFPADTRIGIYVMPYYDINDIATTGRCNCAWKNRAVYGTDRDQYLLVSALHQPMVLNGSDFGTLDPGDGRANLPVCMRQFKNELMVWQEEKGTDGGCFTLFEGYNPDTYGKLVLSTKLGALNAKSAVVVEGVEVSTETGIEVRTVVYVLSHYGVYMSDGRFCTMISDDIRDRFDTTNANCIRRGYESDMWIAYDSVFNVLRLGLVCGTGEVPNVFPVYDITDSAWMFDTGLGLSSMCEVESGSGTAPVVLCGGGSADGLVHLLNSGTTDNGVAIDSYATVELDGAGLVINLRELILAKDGDVTLTPYQDGTVQTAKVI